MPILADDDVVVHRNAERLRNLDNHSRHLNIGARRRWVSSLMIVHRPTPVDIALFDQNISNYLGSRGRALGRYVFPIFHRHVPSRGFSADHF